jgi:hypothetical protein
MVIFLLTFLLYLDLGFRLLPRLFVLTRGEVGALIELDSR